jgi:hypothetical protein
MSQCQPSSNYCSALSFQRILITTTGTTVPFSDLHGSTFGITSYVLAQFAVAFSTLIHDVDQLGVPDGQLAKDSPKMYEKYKIRVLLFAEQNSIDLAWDLLMDQDFIFTKEKEIRRFRQCVVNLVMATDIFEKDMKILRNQGWEKAFFKEKRERRHSDRFHCFCDNLTVSATTLTTFTAAATTKQGLEAANFKATIALEQIIQTANVSHPMQHWAVYKKWNQKLFQEMYGAYDARLAEKDPSQGSYGGELWFFNNCEVMVEAAENDIGLGSVSNRSNQLKWQTFVARLRRKISREKASIT